MARVSTAKPVWLGVFGWTDLTGMEPDCAPAPSKLNGSGHKRSFRHYRRSTTSKAPRKRTFVMNMSKYTAGLLPRQNGLLNGCGFPFKTHAFNFTFDEGLEQNPADYGSGGAGHGRDPNLVSSHRVQTARFLLSRDMAVLAAAAALRPALLALHLSAHQLACAAARLHTALAQQHQLEQQQQHPERQHAQPQQAQHQDADASALALRDRSPSPTPTPAAAATRKRRSPFQAALQAAAHTSSPHTSDPTSKRPRAASPPPPATPPPTHDAFLRAALGHLAAPALPDLNLGQLLGSGAHGVVYAGTWAGRAAAIKLATHPTPAPAAATPTPAASSAAASLSREAHLLPTLHHPNIVTCLHAAPAPANPADNNAPAGPAPAAPNPLLIMELLPNGSLDTLLHGPHAPAARTALLPQILARHAPNPAPAPAPAPAAPSPAAHRLVLLSLLRDAAAGLHHLHTRPAPVVHRDLKPENILVSAAATAKLSDFGVALVLDPTPGADPPLHPTFAPAADIFGTVQYSAPEDLWGVGSNSGSSRVGPGADVFSLGCVLWEVLAGRRPWEGLDTVQVMYGVGSGGQRLPVDAAAWPADLVALMRACWAAEPAARPDAGQAGAVLARHVAALAAQVAAA